MTTPTKGKSPFYPGQPVPVELFVGRRSQLDRILQRGAGQVASGKPVSLFVQGEYGIGKSSIAAIARRVSEERDDLHAILRKIARAGLEMSFQRSDVGRELTESERRKCNNFLQRMKRLNVLRSGDVRGEYVFNLRMVGLYIWLNAQRKLRT